MEPFRYRAKDAWRAITRIAVRDARLKEIKNQIFNSEKLKVNGIVTCLRNCKFYEITLSELF